MFCFFSGLLKLKTFRIWSLSHNFPYMVLVWEDIPCAWIAVCYTFNANGQSRLYTKHVTKHLLHKTPTDVPVLTVKAKPSHLVSIDTDTLMIIHPFSCFVQDLDPFYFLFILLLQGMKREVNMERWRQ